MKRNDRSDNRIIFAIVFLLLILVCIGIKSINQGEEDVKYGVCQVLLDGNKAYIDNDVMAVLDGTDIIIGKSGTYRIGGNSEAFSIIVRTEDLDDVNIIFENLSMGSPDYTPFFAEKAKHINLFLEGDNVLSDGYEYANQIDGKPNACIYSKADMSISGTGSLKVSGNYHHGISVRGDMNIDSGSIVVNSAKNGIDLKDELFVSGGDIVIEAANDGISAGTKDDTQKGSVHIVSGHIDISAADDGIFANNLLQIEGGKTLITSGGEIAKCDGSLLINNECVYARTAVRE